MKEEYGVCDLDNMRLLRGQKFLKHGDHTPVATMRLRTYLA